MDKVFKAYDIRGIYPSELNEALFQKIGNALRFFGAEKLVVGSDMRASSEPLRKALIEGARDAGISVIDIGLSSTPMLYQASHDFDVDLGVIITASHNPKEFNGMKLCKKDAYPIAWDNGIEELKDWVKERDYLAAEERGSYEEAFEYKNKYKEYLSSFVDTKKKLKVVFDPGNGMGGHIDLELLRSICELVPLYTELDGNFPNHEADPMKPQNLEDLSKKVVEEGADLGLAFDGDADRIGFIDEKGSFVGVDYVTALLVDHFIEKHPEHNHYSYDLRSSKIISELIEKAGKESHKTRVGHSFIKRMMRENGSVFSSELSGHLYFKFQDTVIYDSALRSAIEIISVLSQKDKVFSELLSQYRVYAKGPEVNFLVDDKTKKIEEIKEHFKDAKQEELDGITIEYETWWCNIRASNTEDKLRLNLEANSQERYDEKLMEITRLLE
jgi:phosphomannomutase